MTDREASKIELQLARGGNVGLDTELRLLQWRRKKFSRAGKQGLDGLPSDDDVTRLLQLEAIDAEIERLRQAISQSGRGGDGVVGQESKRSSRNVPR